MTREEIIEQFYIEDHAVLYALMMRAAIKHKVEDGKQAGIKGTILYARERGLRMAMRAMNDGEDLTPNNYICYVEWLDSRKIGRAEVMSVTPEYRTNSYACGWCTSWLEHDLLEYGKIYCDYIDTELVKGFNPNNNLEIGSILSKGEECCSFHWVGVKFANNEELTANREKKAALAPKVLKDFLYHTGHILSAMSRTFYIELGVVAGKQIAETALAEYSEKFGEEKTEFLLKEAKLDFLKV